MSKSYAEICPCKDCTKRTAECHGKCEDYKEWLATGREVPPIEPWVATRAHEKAYDKRRHRGK